MARIRTVKPSYWTSEQVMNCSRDARLLFIGLWNFCDDKGVHPLALRTIKAEIFPGDDDVTIAGIDSMLAELIDADLIATFDAAGKTYLYVTGWSHQRIDNPSRSRYPAPPAPPAPPPENLPEDSPSDPVATQEGYPMALRGIPEDSTRAMGTLLPEGKGREGSTDVVVPLDLGKSRRPSAVAGPDGLRPPPAGTTAAKSTSQDQDPPPPASSVNADAVLTLCREVMPSAKLASVTRSLRNVVAARERDGTLPDLDAWEDYLRWCSRSAFLRGEGPDNPATGQPFHPDLVWLATQEHYARIAAGQYHKPGERSRRRASGVA